MRAAWRQEDSYLLQVGRQVVPASSAKPAVSLPNMLTAHVPSAIAASIARKAAFGLVQPDEAIE